MAWSLRVLADCAAIESVLVAAPPGSEERVEEIAAGCGMAVSVAAGGRSRAESVALAGGRVETELVAIHDAARPLATPRLLGSVLDALVADVDADGAIAARRISETIKRAEGEPAAIGETVPRAGLWAAETPQAFRTEKLRAAQAEARDLCELDDATDEAMLIERAGGRVLLVESGAPNPKVTTPADLALAAALLAKSRYSARVTR